MRKQCPQCREMYVGYKCDCGFSAQEFQAQGPRLCSWNTQGRTCLLSGAITHSTVSEGHVKAKSYPDVYCGFHFNCQSDPKSCRESEFRAWAIKRGIDRKWDNSSFDYIGHLWKLANGHQSSAPVIPEDPPHFDINDKRQMTGVFIMRDSSPTLYKKLLVKHPKLEAAMVGFKPLGTGIKSVNEVLGIELDDEENERLRSVSIADFEYREEL